MVSAKPIRSAGTGTDFAVGLCQRTEDLAGTLPQFFRCNQMANPLRMTEYHRPGKLPQQGTGATGVVDVDVGEQHVVEPLHPLAAQLRAEAGNGGKGAGIDEQSKTVTPVEPGADERAESFEGRQVEIDAAEVVQVH